MLTESWLQSKVGTTIFARGKSYLAEDSIEDTTRKGQTLIAHVQGSRYKPYRVTINFDQNNGVEEADCTCPYGEEWDGWCKHIVAVILQEIRAATVAEPAEVPKTTVKTPRKRSDVDSDAIQKDVRRQFKRFERSYNEYEAGDDVAELLNEYAQCTYERLDCSLPDSALEILQAFLGVFLERWADYAHEDVALFDGFGQELAAKLLRTPLTNKQREEWLAALVSWKSELNDYGEEESLSAACDIVKNSQSVSGESRAATELRLALLEEQARWEDALALANQANWPGRATLYLSYLNRLEEMERVATEKVADFSEAECLTLVATLQYKVPSPALRIAKVFLQHLLRPRDSGSYVSYESVRKLAEKVLELGQKQGDRDACCAAREALLLAAPTLALWKEHLAALDPSEHEAVRARLLQMLLGRGGGGHSEQIAILLEEKEWESAWSIAIHGYNSTHHALPTAQKLVAHLPQPLRDYGLRIATPIMASNQSGQYELAAAWLAVVRTAEIAMGRGREWNVRYETLLLENKRKYKLMPMLQELEHAPEGEAPPPPAPKPPAERMRLVFKVD